MTESFFGDKMLVALIAYTVAGSSEWTIDFLSNFFQDLIAFRSRCTACFTLISSTNFLQTLVGNKSFQEIFPSMQKFRANVSGAYLKFVTIKNCTSTTALLFTDNFMLNIYHLTFHSQNVLIFWQIWAISSLGEPEKSHFYLQEWNKLSTTTIVTLSMERNPFSAKNQTLRSYRVYFSPTK